jgi:hypothetical protein
MPEQDNFIHTLRHLYFSFPSSASFPARSLLSFALSEGMLNCNFR